ncbi:MAG: GNAT family N-acetyltransferase [Oscillospiraceae bacterium]|nr:GNAT family N-acetyltransferase [Oscillospiraceae bacterium]
MNRERMADAIETERLVLFPYTRENLALFNDDLPGFEAAYGVVYQGEELDHLLRGFLKKLEQEIADDPENYLFFTEFLIVLKENDHVIGSIDYKYVPKDGVTEVGYGLNPAYEGRGCMTEALTAFLALGKKLGIRTVRADTLKDNVKSRNVLKRCGFRFLKEEENLWWERSL